MKKQKTYVYVCSVGHEYVTDRPLNYSIVGCQVMIACGLWDYTQCGLWCWPKIDGSRAPREDRDAH